MSWLRLAAVTVLVAGAVAAVGFWRQQTPWSPGPGLSFQWQLSDYPVDTSIAADVYDLDYQETPAELVAALHARGTRVVCYVSAGTWEAYRPDADAFPAEVIGLPLDDFPDERWLDVRRTDVLLPLLEPRVQTCRDKGFDAVEFDNVDGYANASGFPLTAADQLAFNEALAALARERRLTPVLKNDLEQAEELVGTFGMLLLEQCVEFDECDLAAPFLDRRLLVVDVEYDVTPAEGCPIAERLGITMIFKDLALDAPRTTCG